MLHLSPQVKIFVAIDPVDFRRGIDGLGMICRTVFQKNPLEGAIFVFRNKRGQSIKILAYDGQGFWLCTKRLSSGKFRFWPDRVDISNLELHTLISNGNPKGAAFPDPWRKL